MRRPWASRMNHNRVRDARVEERPQDRASVQCIAQVRSAARSAFATICGGPAPASPQGPLGARVRFFRTSPILA